MPESGTPAYRNRCKMPAYLLRGETGRIAGADDGADRATGHHLGPYAKLVESFEHGDVRDAARSAAAEGERNGRMIGRA
jgi:hypothetical protein